MARHISNSDDIIDSRDIIARIEELTAEREDIEAACESDGPDDTNTAGKVEELAAWDDENGEELAALVALAAEGESLPDWKHGEALVRDSYFKEYAEQLADDIGAIDRNATWPCNCIDWDKAAEQLQTDYMAVDYDGVAYWIRA